MLFSQVHLAWMLGVSFPDLVSQAQSPTYRTFVIPKQRGGHRRIEAPGRLLKYIQTQIRLTITSRLAVSEQAHGFVPGRSIVTNARPHVLQPVIAKFDIEDYFGSIGRERVSDVFEGLGYAPPVVAIMTDLCTKDDALPQGAPTSPSLANAVTVRMDGDLLELATAHGLQFTRYADDLTFSGRKAGNLHIRAAVARIVHRHGFRLNEDKTAVLSRATRQRVTGIVVNDLANWPRDRRRWLRQQIHYLERFGLDGHLRRQVTAGGGSSRANYRDFIYGHVYALHSVRPDEAVEHLRRLDAVRWPGVPVQDADAA